MCLLVTYGKCSDKISTTRISHYEKKLARLLFDFGVLNTTDDDCKQQVPSVAFVYNSWQHRLWDDGRARFTTAVVWRQVEHEAVLIFAHIFLYLKPEYLPRGTSGKILMDNRIRDANFLMLLLSNNAILLSFWDTSTGRTTDDGDRPTRISGPWRDMYT